MKIIHLRTEYKVNPTGIDTPAPRLSWQILSDQRGTAQTAYQIKAALSRENLKQKNNLFWDTGIIHSDQSIHVAYAGKELKSGQRIFWQVTVRDNKGNEVTSEETAYWEMGLLHPDDWKASWIVAGISGDPEKSAPCPCLRKEFELIKAIKEARIYVSAMGLYHLSLNGRKVGDELFTPGWTSYHHRIQYQVFDVTQQVKNGKNALGAVLGDGWYSGYLGWQGDKNLYGDKTAFILQLKIVYADNTEQWILTDESWKWSAGPLLESDIYHGERYDARKECRGWDKVNFNDTGWRDVVILDHSKDLLVASEGSPVKITGTVRPVKKITTPRGETVFDLGQNITGRVQFKLRAPAGTSITLNHAEVLDSNGNFYTDNLRAARAEDTYIFKGEGLESYEPHFTFHGFRYIKVSGYPGEITLNDICGKVIHSDMEPIGDFSCSDTMISQLQSNIQWGMRGNFLDVPTDCPQRDERMGWTGDAQVFAPTACFNMLAAPFFTKWMKDFIYDQKADGSVPWVVPNVIKDGGGTGWSDGYGATGWADAAVIIPWVVYRAYGDSRILEIQYKSMKAWVEYMIRHAGERHIFDYGFHFGDWLAFAEHASYQYDAPDYGYAGAHTDKDLIATAYFYYSTGIMQKVAAILGYEEDAARYGEILPKIRSAFQKEFITGTGRLVSGTQTAYVLALSFGIIPDRFKKTAAKRLADDVRHIGHITTGFLGTPLICQALTDNGYPELAYQLLFNKRYPSWLYPVTMGATTIWERWDSIRPDGSFQTTDMNSFNHYAYGAVGNWLYTSVAGLKTDEDYPGYKHIIIKPCFTGDLSYARASLKSMYGEVFSQWEIKKNKVLLLVGIPANTSARLYLPVSDPATIRESGKPLKGREDIILSGRENNGVVLHIGSGNYHFEMNIE